MKMNKRAFLVALKLQRKTQAEGMPAGSPVRDKKAERITRFINKYYFEPLNASVNRQWVIINNNVIII
jgi:hypothetical protein